VAVGISQHPALSLHLCCVAELVVVQVSVLCSGVAGVGKDQLVVSRLDGGQPPLAVLLPGYATQHVRTAVLYYCINDVRTKSVLLPLLYCCPDMQHNMYVLLAILLY
jgi:hypothetical protein